MKIGYARVSSVGQNLESQIKSLKDFGCEKIFEEKVSGTSTKGRDKLRECLDYVRDSDVFCVTRIDRCIRSVLDMQLIRKFHLLLLNNQSIHQHLKENVF